MRLYLIGVLALSMLTLSGCGDSTTSGASRVHQGTSDAGENIRMEQGRAYIIQKGDKIEKISQNPELKIEANLKTGKSIVTLISGTASIVRGTN